jgi:hypothetical protein
MKAVSLSVFMTVPAHPMRSIPGKRRTVAPDNLGGEPVPEACYGSVVAGDSSRPGSEGTLIRAAGTMVLVVAMVVLFFVLVFWDGAAEFLRSNQLEQAKRIPLMVGTGVTGAVVTAIATRLLFKRRGADGVALLDRTSRWLLPLLLLPFVPAFWYGTWNSNLKTSIYLAAFVLVLEWTTRVSADAWWPLDSIRVRLRKRQETNRIGDWIAEKGPLATVLVATLTYVVWASIWTVATHHKFGTEGYDLGQYDNLFWNTLHGVWLRCYPLELTENWHALRNHADLAVFWLLPFYAISPRAETLLVILQSNLPRLKLQGLPWVAANSSQHTATRHAIVLQIARRARKAAFEYLR